jgi:hypothetical protein
MNADNCSTAGLPQLQFWPARDVVNFPVGLYQPKW